MVTTLDNFVKKDDLKLERPATFEELGMDPQNKGIISVFLEFVSAEELCKSLGMNEKLNCLVFHSPGTDKSSIIAAMADYLGSSILLKNLRLGSKSLHTLPDSTRLVHLSLKGCNLSHLPSGIGNLVSLETLNLETNNICTLPDSISSCTRLEHLSLKGCNLSHLPSEIGELGSLKTLNLEGNNICTKLERLQLFYESAEDCASLESIPLEFNQLGLEMRCTGTNKLAENDFANPLLKQFHTSKGLAGLGNLVSLKDLRLEGNNIRIIPDSIGKLCRLYHLLLGDCARLQSLPKLPTSDVSAQDCASLESIQLEFNQLGLEMRCTGGNKLAENDFANPLPKQLHRSKLMLSGLLESIHGLLSSCGDERIVIRATNHNHIDRVDAALLHPLNIDSYIHTLSPQPIAIPDGGEIVQLDSSERKPLEDFDATSNMAYQSDILVSNSERKSTREASRRQCMPQSVLSLVDSTTRISSTDFNAPNNSARLVRADQTGPIGFNSEKKDLGEGLNRECLTKSLLSLDDSSRQKLLPDVEATKNKAYFFRAYQKDLVVSLSENKNKGEALQRECITKSILGLEDLQQHFGGRRDAAAKNFGAIYDPGIHTTDSLAQKSFKAVETLPTPEQPNDCVPLLSIGRLTPEGWEQQKKSPNLPRVLQINVVEQRVTKLPICLEGLTAESASSSHWPFGLPDGRHIVLLDPLEQYTKNVAHAAWVDQCSPTVSLPEKKMVRKTLKKKCRTVCVIFESHQQHFGGRSEGSTKSFCATHIGGKHGTNRLSTVKCIHKQHVIHQWPFRQSASSSLWLIGLPDGRHIVVLDPLEQSTKNVAHAARVDQCSPTVFLLEKKMLRKTLKRKCRTMSVIFEIHQQHFGRKCEGSAKSFHATCIGKKHGTNQVSTVKRIHKQHRIHQWPFRHKWATRKRFSAGDKRSFQVSRVSMNEKLGSRLQFIHMSQSAKADESGPPVFNSEKGRLREALKCDSLTNTHSLNDLREHFGARRKDAAKGLCDSLALKSFEVLDSLPLGEQSNSIRNLARRRTLTHKHCVRLKKSQDLQQSLLSDCSGELAAQAPLGLSDGGHIPSLPEKKIVRKTLKRKSRTMSVISLEDHQQHVGRRWEDDAKFLGAKRICRQLAIDCKPTEKRILKQHGTRRCQSKQSAIDLPDGGHTLSLSKKKIVRKTLKRKYRNMSVLRSEYHQHVNSKWDDSVKSLGAKHIYRQLVIHRVSRAKRIRRQHGFHRWSFQQNWATLKGYFLGDERPVAVISLSIDGKHVSRLQLIHISWLGRFSPRPPALPPGGEIVGPPRALSSSQLPSTSNRAQLGGQDRSCSTASHSQNERTRDQPEGRKRKIKHFTIEDLRPLVHLSREDAAKELGVSVATLKRRRKKLGIVRWPILPPKEVFIPPDPDGENNPPPTSNMLSTNEQITMEIGMGGPNSEPNERLPNSFEDPSFQNMGNRSIAEFENSWTFYDSHHGHDCDADFLFPDVFNGTEAAGGSGYLWEQGFESSDPMFPVYSDAAAPSQSAPQIASTQIPRENMGEDWRSFLAPQEEPLPDLAPSQDMPTAADTMESSEYLRDPLASVVGHRIEKNHCGTSNLIDPSCSNLALSQPMQPTIPHMTPLLTERQDSRPVKLYATYGRYQIKLHLPLMPGIMELKLAVSKQLGLGLDSGFEVWYKDERGEWILMTDDEEIRELLQLTSSENQVSKRLVIKVLNTTGFCGNCECDKCRSLKGEGPCHV